MDETSRKTARTYQSPTRRRQAEQTRERIVTAGSELVHQYRSWDWRALTFRAVAERAGVGERTVYRHFPTERELHDAVMRRLEDEAGIDYEAVDLTNLTDITDRFFASLRRFTVERTVRRPDDPVFAGADERRRRALLRALGAEASNWPEQRQRAVAGLLDVLWNLPAYERLVDAWELSPADAAESLTWLAGRIIAAVHAGEGPATGQ
ncbi:TetR family transcriptional regulator [Mycolicibacterium duvalii]|uniref:Transcriptional regulator n=1 Tax=Mycolicibacterium duvalii TaxID=39688 RepID=A0A7I7K1H5_9MYCO|nr:TetR/AcrR family transcriptional regulator [Mycolicibacterium duvalii]MCV7367281.1 helix-turn-helix transcriptional regulator [Mycolicibacterium duvalii]PEG43557.1 TetR family transcriptional regulator [Mycolicibacterium duvalii]BBX17349.1 transcriptional regulator [Mycolicibacterium duvalii]